VSFSNIILFYLKVESGTLVELFLKNEPRYGVIKWLGNFPPPDHHVEMAGIELVMIISFFREPFFKV